MKDFMGAMCGDETIYPLSAPLADNLQLVHIGKIVIVIGILPSSQGTQIRIFGKDKDRVLDNVLQVKIDRFGAYKYFHLNF